MQPNDAQIAHEVDDAIAEWGEVTRHNAVAIAQWARDQMIPQWWKRDLDPHELYEPFDLIVVAYRSLRATSMVTVREYGQCEHVSAWRAFIPGIDTPLDWPLEGDGE